MPVNLTNIGEITPATSPLEVNGSLNLIGTGVGYQVNGAALITGLGVQHAGVAVATQPAINLTDTATATFNVANDAGNNRVNISVTAIAAGALADPTTTLGDLIVRGATAPPTRLAVGTNGQVLRADSTVTTLGMAWQTIDASNLNLNPTGTTWTTIQDAIEGLETDSPGSLLTAQGDLLTRSATALARLAHGTQGQVLTVDTAQPNAIHWAALPASPGTILTTLGDLIVRGTAAPVRLAVGTNGQVLAADSTAPNGLHWTTLDAADIDLAPQVGTWTTVQAAVAGLHTASPSSLLTAQGDLLTHSATALARLAHGTQGQVLTVDTAQPNAIHWATPAASPSTILTTLGDLIVRGPAAAVRLGVGTNGQVLVADSAATNGLHWATLDAADIDLAPQVSTWTTVQAAVAGLNTASPTTVLTTLGDLLVRGTAAPVRLPVGSNGQVLEADNAAPNGLHWATPANPANILTTLGDIIVRGPTTAVRLPIGTNGQVLEADSTATNGVHWATPDPSAADILTTKGDLLTFATAPVRHGVGTNNQVVMADSTTTDGIKWAAMTADLVAMNPTLNTTWTTVQNSIAAISNALTVLSRGMAYVGHYDAAGDAATFVPSLSALDGPLPAANATGLEEGDFLVVTTPRATAPALNVGDQLISGGPTGGATWIILPIGANMASVTAATVPLAPDINSWGTVQGAITSLNTRAAAAGAAGQVQFNAGGTPAAFGASANLHWDTANNRLGVNTATPAFALHVVGAINTTLGVYVNGVLFAEPGSAHLKATDITGLEGEPLAIIGKLSHNGREIELDALLDRLEKLEAALARMN